MRDDVVFSNKNSDISGYAYVEENRLQLAAMPQRNKVLEWIMGSLGAFLGSRTEFFAKIGLKIGETQVTWSYQLYNYIWVFWSIGIAVSAFLGVLIARRIARGDGSEKVYHSFYATEVHKISYLPVSDHVKNPIYRVYLNGEKDFIKIRCNADSEFHAFMKSTFANVITEVDH